LLIRTEKADDDGVRVAVVDSGPELPPALFEHLFEPFYTTKAAGLGIRIVERLDPRHQHSLPLR
jgi:signal transduction histidine kinase